MIVELQVRIAQLEQQLEEEGVKGGMVGELQEQVKVMEEQLARLQTEVGTFWSAIWVMCILMEQSLISGTLFLLSSPSLPLSLPPSLPPFLSSAGGLPGRCPFP